MINSPPSATTGSSLYMHFPATQISSYIGGAHDNTVLNGCGLVGIWSARHNSLASSHAPSGVPIKRPASDLSGATTIAQHKRSTFTIAPARSTTLRTGVHLLPMIIGFVQTAPSQWKKFRIFGPPTPGNRYLLPPENPTTSCGNTGPTMMIWS